MDDNLVNASEKQKARVLLPPGYESELDTKYPVVYYVHGFSSDYRYDENLFTWASDAINYGTYDEYKWIVNGCRSLIDLLDENGIPNFEYELSGGHALYESQIKRVSRLERRRVSCIPQCFFSKSIHPNQRGVAHTLAGSSCLQAR